MARSQLIDRAIFVGGGMVFGFGLAYSGMTQPEVVLSFLTLEDLGLLLVMGGAIAATLPVFRWLRKPLLAEKPGPFAATVSMPTVFGSVVFGVGWGISGVCPGAAIASLGTGNHPILIAVLAMFAGAYLQGLLYGRKPAVRVMAPPAVDRGP